MPPRITSAVTASTVGVAEMRPRLPARRTRSTFVMRTPYLGARPARLPDACGREVYRRGSRESSGAVIAPRSCDQMVGGTVGLPSRGAERVLVCNRALEEQVHVV